MLVREKALNNIISSIAAGETALSLLIAAESKKIEYALACARARGCSDKELSMVLEVNKSVNSMMGRVAEIEMILKNKLELVAELLPPLPPPPKPPSPTYTCEEFMDMPFPFDMFTPPHREGLVADEQGNQHHAPGV